MPLSKVNAGTNEDGSPRWLYTHDNDPNEAVVFVGPYINGHVTVADGTTYDVTEHAIAVKKGHEGEVACLLGKRHEAEGHPMVRDPNVPFVHVCNEVCGG